jgi:uncharacterized coiled-coil protein SlyX
MMSKNDGGPTFPIPAFDNKMDHPADRIWNHAKEGMSLRDYEDGLLPVDDMVKQLRAQGNGFVVSSKVADRIEELERQLAERELLLRKLGAAVLARDEAYNAALEEAAQTVDAYQVQVNTQRALIAELVEALTKARIYVERSDAALEAGRLGLIDAALAKAKAVTP